MHCVGVCWDCYHPNTAEPAKPAAKFVPPAPATYVPVTLTAEQIAAVEKRIADELKDPESARFDRIKAVAAPNEPKALMICGRVNGHNSYGAYVDRRPFTVAMYDGKPGRQVWIADEKSDAAVAKFCASYNIDLTTDQPARHGDRCRVEGPGERSPARRWAL